ncbi:cysteine desulfurase family protein [Gracilimonas amylolytica]|uniref:cysteine desulfurase family protein n=1 Tax=Gracilimonas amylolytica TaxID=1749045 RepID=UPI000CD8D812|nr:cysteine desulfurase family protein [Gracilimonas amylolytica]
MKTVYFDHAATTPLDERVLEAMMPYLKENYGNPNSAHHLGQKTKVVIEDAREKVASLIGAEPSEIVFTSGGTESDNAVIKGALAVSGNKKEVITSEIEHHAVLHTVEMEKMRGIKPVFAKPDATGKITADAVREAINENTALVSLMHVNNEIGTINPLSEIAEVCREFDVPFHSDTVQSLGKLPVDVRELGIDFLSGSAHKIYGPKGTGIMYVKNGARWVPWMIGGSQERRRRGGTLNVPGIVGFTKALELAIEEMDNHTARFTKLRSLLLEQLREKLSVKVTVNGPQDNGVPHILNLSFSDADNKHIDGEMLLLNLDIEGICVSNGSACTSGAVEPSHVLAGIGMEPNLANSSIRVSLGKQNTEEDITYLVDKLDAVLDRMFTIA